MKTLFHQNYISTVDQLLLIQDYGKGEWVMVTLLRTKTWQASVYMGRGVGRGGGGVGGSDPPFLGANFIHFLYKVLG